MINSTLEIDCKDYQQIPSSSAGTQLSPRIYMHIQDESQRLAAEDLKAWLEGQRYARLKTIVPGVENVGPRNLRESQLRYFHDNVDELNLAWGIVNSLQSLCVKVVPPQLIKGYENSTSIRARHYELWLTPDALNNYRCVNNGSAQAR
jgi:hypothetical protein